MSFKENWKYEIDTMQHKHPLLACPWHWCHKVTCQPPQNPNKLFKPSSLSSTSCRDSPVSQSYSKIAEPLTESQEPMPTVFSRDPITYNEWRTSFTSLVDCKGISADKLHLMKRYVVFNIFVTVMKNGEGLTSIMVKPLLSTELSEANCVKGLIGWEDADGSQTFLDVFKPSRVYLIILKQRKGFMALSNQLQMKPRLCPCVALYWLSCSAACFLLLFIEWPWDCIKVPINKIEMIIIWCKMFSYQKKERRKKNLYN